MPWEIELALFGLLILSAIIALEVRDMLAAVAALGFYSFFTAVLLAVLGAIDVAFTEAALGAGVIGVLFVAGLFVIGRRSVD